MKPYLLNSLGCGVVKAWIREHVCCTSLKWLMHTITLGSHKIESQAPEPG